MIFDFSLPNNFAKDSPKKDLALPEGANGLVVHCCCAPCSTSLVECLIFNKIKPLMFFYNPNIYPLEEYEKRRDESDSRKSDKYIKQCSRRHRCHYRYSCSDTLCTQAPQKQSDVTHVL